MSYETLVTAVNFVNVETAILGVSVALAGLYISTRGARIVLGFMKR